MRLRLTKPVCQDMRKHGEAVDAAASYLETVAETMRVVYDARSESWQESAAAVEADVWVGSLEVAAELLRDAADELSAIKLAPEQA